MVKLENEIDITLCVPFIAEKTPSQEFYRENKIKMQNDIQEFVNSWPGKNPQCVYRVTINTRDFGEHAYVVAFGSALDKGDFGAVGRGNKYSGVITLQRKTNVEAPAGKNPQLHSGKLFTIFAHHLAWKIYEQYRCPISVDIAAKAGESIDDPFAIMIQREDGRSFSQKECEEIESKTRDDIKKIKGYKEKIIVQNPIAQHKKKNFIYD